ncbi:ABC transporter ATP-binding protein [Oscillospiraceae bacterium HV4-5-C5C]|nr:ABC transporter ATP-binding protein [Oscillospiraceae bacterium HV4-5-C5C]
MLEVVDVSKTFNPGTVNENPVLKGLSLKLSPGDFVTIIGGNGAGKSTLMNIISGVLFPDHGRVYLGTHDVTYMPEYRRAKFLGRVFQDPMQGTAGDMEVVENLAMASQRGSFRGLNWNLKSRQFAYFQELLASLDLGLENRLHAKVKLLSGGQRQALTLLMASMNQPDLLLLDEHTAALDPKTAQKVMQVTQRVVSADHLTTLMITHNMQQAIQYGNRLIMMDSGKIVLDIAGEDKKELTVEQLLAKFVTASGNALANDRMLLS